MKRFAAPLLLLMLAAGASQAQQQQPCATADAAGQVPLGQSPRVAVLHRKDLTQWQPPTCAGWPPAQHAKLVITLTGTFRFDGTMNDLLARVGEISRLRAIPYWSPRDRKWMPLARDASALNSPDAKDRRGDFSLSELKTGAVLYYWEDDPLAGEKIDALNVYERTADRAVIGTDNVTAIRKGIFTLFKPGQSRSALFLQRISPGVFSARLMASAMQGSSSLVEGHDDIYVSRARALFGFLSASKSADAPLALSADR